MSLERDDDSPQPGTSGLREGQDHPNQCEPPSRYESYIPSQFHLNAAESAVNWAESRVHRRQDIRSWSGSEEILGAVTHYLLDFLNFFVETAGTEELGSCRKTSHPLIT